MVRCRLLGHRFRFESEGAEMRWQCQRGCGAGGAKRYPTAADARRYAAGLDREDRDGPRAPRAAHRRPAAAARARPAPVARIRAVT